MAATLSTFTSNLTAPVNFVLMRRLLSAARKKLPYFNGTLPGTLDRAKGSASVKWRRIENLSPATTALSEVTGTAAAFLGRTAVQPTITDINVAVAKYGNPILITEEVDLFNVNSNTVALMDTLGANAGESLNILMAAAYTSGFTNTRNANNATNYTSIVSAITLNDIKYAVNRLNQQSAMKFTPQGFGSTNVGTSPIRDAYLGICHVDVEEDIRALSGFLDVVQYGGYVQTYPFEFGSVAGVRFCSTEIAPIETSGSHESAVATTYRGASAILHDIYKTYIYGMEAIGTVGLGNMHATNSYEMYNPATPPAVEVIQHAPGSSGVFDMFNEVGSIAWKAWFAGKVLNAQWGVAIHSLSAQL